MSMATPILPGDYITRGGQRAVVCATGAPGIYPLVGYVLDLEDEPTTPCMWTRAGTYYRTCDDELDLIAEVTTRNPPPESRL